MIDVVLFTSEGREAYIRPALHRYAAALNSPAIGSRILAVDGTLDMTATVDCARSVDTTVMARVSRGYFSNIVQGVAQVQTEYFFWAEDDFEIDSAPDLPALVGTLNRVPSLAQIRWSRLPELLLEDKNAGRLGGSLWLQGYFYSFNPHIARTSFVRSTLDRLLAGGYPGENIEVAFSKELRRQGLVSAVIDPALAKATHRGPVHVQESSYYAKHRLPSRGSAPKPEGTGAGGRGAASTVTKKSGVLGNKAMEVVLKSCFAIGVTVGSILSAPFSRQARAFIRTVWRYWRPLFSVPTYQGCTRDDGI